MPVDYVEQVAVAVAVRAAKASNSAVFSAEFLSDSAFFGFGGFFEKNFQDFRRVIVEEVVDVPELALLFPEMSGYSFFKVCLR